jgi:voltage-gated potassium channel
MTPTVPVRAFRSFLFAAIALVVLLVVGTVGYRWLEGIGTLDSFYMTVITISTVGFGEVKPFSAAGRLFTVGLIICGGGLAAYTLSGFAEFVLSDEWRVRWERKRRLRMLSQLSNHIIVCGYGRVGRQVAHELQAEGLPFVVIDNNSEKIEHIRTAEYLALHGNAADETSLKQGGIERAQGLVAAANTDAENVFIVLTARSLRPDLLIVARSNYEESEPKLLRAGANRVISPYSISGHRMVTMLVRPDVADFLDEVSHASGIELLLEQVRLAPKSSLVGKTLAQAEFGSRLGITVVACKLPDQQINSRPGADTVLQAHTQLIALGTREQLQALIKVALG